MKFMGAEEALHVGNAQWRRLRNSGLRYERGFKGALTVWWAVYWDRAAADDGRMRQGPEFDQ